MELGGPAADFGILIARTDPDVPKHRGITFFIVDMRSPGVDVRRLRQATGQAHFNEVFLDEVRIPAANVVGEIGGGWAVTRTVLSSEAGMIGSGGSGSPAGFDTLLRTARELGRDQDPVVRVELAGDLWMREQLMRVPRDALPGVPARRPRHPTPTRRCSRTSSPPPTRA